eukprot:6044836-Pyramimonas_sp.AAC.1
MQRLAPRALGQGPAFAEPIQPTRSIAQGLRGGTRLARCLACFRLDRITNAHPGTGSRIWIDDLSQRARASRKVLKDWLTARLLDTCLALRGLQLTASPKSISRGTRIDDARH